MDASSAPPPSPNTAPSSEDEAGFEFKLWHLAIPLLVVIVGLSAILILGVLFYLNGALDKVDVRAGDTDVAFVDAKGKTIDLDPTAIFNPGRTADRLQSGSVQATVHVEVHNKNPFRLKARSVRYRVHVNNIDAGPGRLPEDGEPAIEIPAKGTYRRAVTVAVPTRKLIKGGAARVLQGGKLKLRIHGEANAEAMGMSFTREFDVTQTKTYGPDTGGGSSSPLPLPIPLP